MPLAFKMSFSAKIWHYYNLQESVAHFSQTTSNIASVRVNFSTEVVLFTTIFIALHVALKLRMWKSMTQYVSNVLQSHCISRAKNFGMYSPGGHPWGSLVGIRFLGWWGWSPPQPLLLPLPPSGTVVGTGWNRSGNRCGKGTGCWGSPQEIQGSSAPCSSSAKTSWLIRSDLFTFFTPLRRSSRKSTELEKFEFHGLEGY